MKIYDRVVKGLECCIKQAENDVYCENIGCPYHEPTNAMARLTCWTKLNRDALKLIKAQRNEVVSADAD